MKLTIQCGSQVCVVYVYICSSGIMILIRNPNRNPTKLTLIQSLLFKNKTTYMYRRNKKKKPSMPLSVLNLSFFSPAIYEFICQNCKNDVCSRTAITSCECVLVHMPDINRVDSSVNKSNTKSLFGVQKFSAVHMNGHSFVR
jgi:hypothetical protein